ncbi:hypothetical protein [Bacillus sp. AK128]
MKHIKLVILLCLLMSGCSTASTGNPTAQDILEENKDADIIKLDGLIYSRNMTNFNQPEGGYSKGAKIGVIKAKTTNTLWYRNLYASKLPKGTEVFSADEEYQKGDAPFIIIVEVDGELVDYHALIEG